MFDATRPGADEIAARMRTIGVAPDGRIGTAYQDLLFDPLPSGPIDLPQAMGAFTRRLTEAAVVCKCRAAAPNPLAATTAKKTVLSSIVAPSHPSPNCYTIRNSNRVGRYERGATHMDNREVCFNVVEANGFGAAARAWIPHRPR